MAPIRKAKGYLVYLMALVISAIFSWFGRPGPTWAEDVKQEHSAKIFQDTYRQETYRIAQTQTNTGDRYVYNSPTTTRDTVYRPSNENIYGKGADLGIQLNPAVEKEILEHTVTNTTVNYFQSPDTANTEITQAIDAINLKIQNKQELTALEKAFIYSLQINKDLVNQAMLQQVNQGK